MVNTELLIVGIIVLIIAIVVVVPILIIWSLNVLFGLGVVLSLKTWFAALVLGSVVGGSGFKTSGD